MTNNQMLQNAAGTIEGVELAFQGNRCGKSYRIKQDSMKWWTCYFYDWHEEGWIQIDRWPGEKLRKEAIEVCNAHAIEKRLIKFLPNKPKFKPNPDLWGSALAAAQTAAAVAGFSL